MAPLAAGLLAAVTAEGRHQKLLDETDGGAGEKPSATRRRWISLKEKIRAELPSLFNLFRADAYLLKKIVASAATFLDDVKGDPDHPAATRVRPVRRKFRGAAEDIAGLCRAR